MPTDLKSLFLELNFDASDPGHEKGIYQQMLQRYKELFPATGSDLENILNQDSDFEGIAPDIELIIKAKSIDVAEAIMGMLIEDAFKEEGLQETVLKALDGDVYALDQCLPVFLSVVDPHLEVISGFKEEASETMIRDIAEGMNMSLEQKERLAAYLASREELIVKLAIRAIFSPVFDQDHKVDCDAKLNNILQDGINHVLRGFGSPPPLPEV